MMPRDVLTQVRHLIRPLQMRIANTVARAVVGLVDDSLRLQSLQLTVLEGEEVEDAERFQEYGFSSVPVTGAEAVVMFPGGDRGRPYVVAVDDRRFRPTGLAAGEVVVYHQTGAKIHLQSDGDIEIIPAPGREVFIRSSGGSTDRLVKKSEFDSHTHTVPITGAAGTTASTAPLVPAVGTQKLRAE